MTKTKALTIGGGIRVEQIVGLLVVAFVLYLVIRARSSPVQISNLEKWEWVDWKGRSRSISVHRDTRAT